MNQEFPITCNERTSEKVVLEFTVSTRRNKIDVQGMLMYPAIFVLKEEIDSESMGNASEREIIEASQYLSTSLIFPQGEMLTINFSTQRTTSI
jgi:hypothetical protein